MPTIAKTFNCRGPITPENFPPRQYVCCGMCKLPKYFHGIIEDVWQNPAAPVPCADLGRIGFEFTLEYKTDLDPTAYGICGHVWRYEESPPSTFYVQLHLRYDAGRWPVCPDRFGLAGEDFNYRWFLSGPGVPTNEQYGACTSDESGLLTFQVQVENTNVNCVYLTKITSAEGEV